MANEWIVKDYDGAAVATTLSTGVAGGALSLTVASGAGLPDGAAGPFVISIDRLNTEEKVLVDTRSGNTLTLLERGYDGTAAVAHLAGVSIDHVIDAHTLKQANALAGVMDSTGSMAYRGGGFSYVEIPVGANSSMMVVVAGVPSWMTLANAVDLIFSGSTPGAGLSYAAGALAVSVDGSTMVVTADAINVKDAGITATQLATSVAGAGLTGGAGTALSVVTDGIGLEVPVDTLQLKDLGVLEAKIAAGAVTVTKLATDAVETAKIKDLQVTAAKIANDTITTTQIATGNFVDIKNTKLADYCGKAAANAVQTLTTGVSAQIAFAGTDPYDYGAMHNPASNNARITAAVAGIWTFHASVGFAANTAGGRQLNMIRYNSAGVLQEYIAWSAVDAGDSSEPIGLTVSGGTPMAVGDYVVVEALQNSGGNLNTIYFGVGSSISWHCDRLN